MKPIEAFLRYVEFEGADSVVIEKSSFVTDERRYMYCDRGCEQCVNKDLYEKLNRCMLTYKEVLEIKENHPEYFI